MNVRDLSTSRYLKKEEVGDGIEATIKSVVEENVAMDNKPVEMAWIMHFVEIGKPLWLKPTTGGQVAQICGSEESDDWVGKRIELFNDMSVTFNGTRGGIRIRAVRGHQPAKVGIGPSGEDATKLARTSAWAAFKEEHSGESTGEMGAALKATIKSFFGHEDPTKLTAAHWNKMRDARFVPMESPISDEPVLDDIPF